MQISNTQELLKNIAVLDNRKVTPETIKAWHSVIGFLDFEVAKEALRLAQADGTIRYLEPRHIVSWSREARYQIERANPLPVETQEPSEAPKCKHGETIALCLPCCKELADA